MINHNSFKQQALASWLAGQWEGLHLLFLCMGLWGELLMCRQEWCIVIFMELGLKIKNIDPCAKKFDPKGKKPISSIGLMPDVVEEKDKGEDDELMRGWGKV